MDCKPEQGQLGSSSKAGGRKAAPGPTEAGDRHTAKGSECKVSMSCTKDRLLNSGELLQS